MSVQHISFPILGMRGTCPKCAREIERALAQLEGVVAAQVNYATERAMVVYDPMRVTVQAMVNRIRQMDYDTPVDHLILQSDDLLYATSARTVEKVIGKIEGVVSVSADLSARSVSIEIFAEYGRRYYAEGFLGGLGFHAFPTARTDSHLIFLIRTAVLVTTELIVLWSMGADMGFFGSPGPLSIPLFAFALALIVMFGAGWPHYRLAYDAALQSEFDASVLVGFLASAFAITSLPLGILSSSPWIRGVGFLLATTLTGGWFIGRALTLWVVPWVRGTRHPVKLIPAAQAHLGVVSDGSRR